MDTVDSHHLFESKENIQPLRQGRDTSKLCAALQAQTDSELHQTLEKQRNEFEIRLRSTNSEDALADWCDYIHWIEQSYLKQPREGKLHIVLQKCLKKFKDCEKYKNDVRFVKLCIKYAELEESTVELLSQIYRHGIGVKCAELYIAWAEKYALTDCFKKANYIYEKGIANGAEPMELLKQAHQHFHAFLVRRMLNVKEEFKPTFLENLPPESRQPYNVLQPVPSGQREIVSNVRIGPNVKGSPGKLKMGSVQDKKPKSNTCIKIFEDNDDQVSNEPVAKLEKIPNRKKASKENIVKPGPWTDKQSKKVPFSVASTSVPFHVHRDEAEEGESCNRVQSVPSSVLKAHSKKDDDDTLANIPLFYPEPDDKTKAVMYCKEQVYAGGEEFQFEELRAIEYNRRRVERRVEESVVNKSPVVDTPPKTSDCDNKITTVETHEVEPKANVPESVLPFQEDENAEFEKNRVQRRKTLFTAPKPKEKKLQAKCLPEEVLPTTDYSMNQTIHTKEALSEMQQLWFSKPASPLLQDVPVAKPAGKSILKTSRPCFNLYIDESCLDNFKESNQPEGPLDLTLKSNSNPIETSDSTPDKPKTGLGFAIYTDDKETIGKLDRNKLEFDEENKENDIPNNYCGPIGKSTRRVTGILTPAENVAVEELSDVEVDEDDDEDGAEYCGAAQCNTTAVTENLTKAFQFPRNESTPNPRKSFHLKPDVNRSLFDCEEPEEKPEKCKNDVKELRKCQDKMEIMNALQSKRSPSNKDENCMKNLSIIVETSREYKSSSSGSSGISTIRSFKTYPNTPMDLKGPSSSALVTTNTLLKTKKLSLTGYDASTESTGLRSRISTVDKLGNTKDYSDYNRLSSGHHLLGVKEDDEVDDEVENQKTDNEFLGDIDPFSDDVIERLLTLAKYPSSSYAGDMMHVDSALTVPKVGSSVVLGDNRFDLKKVVGEGSYAKVYDLTNKSTGDRAIAKVQKPPCHWEFYIVKELHLRIGDAFTAGSFMQIESAYFFTNASVFLTKPVDYGNLLNTVNILKQNHQICHMAAVYFTVQILRILEVLHSCKIIHADVKPDNFLVMNRNGKPELQIIDFGRSIDMSLLPEGTTFTRVITTSGFTTTEMRTGKPWTYQVDLYGTANCSHCLLYGEYMTVAEKNGVWNITKIIPRYWARNEWKNYFSTLLNIESCDAIPKISDIVQPFEAILADNRQLELTISRLNNLLNGQ